VPHAMRLPYWIDKDLVIYDIMKSSQLVGRLDGSLMVAMKSQLECRRGERANYIKISSESRQC
jgi:hypothetical protein